jgi:hypothetical protein
MTLPSTSETGGTMLREVQRLPSSGARAVEPFAHDGSTYLVIAQLARDQPGQVPSMGAGDSDVATVVYRWTTGAGFVEHQRLAVPGGEDAEFFGIGERRFLATASLRTGRGPYTMDVESVLYELIDGRFQPFQRFATFAAKQWKHFAFDDRVFLALAQGVTAHDGGTAPNAKSCIFEWNGERFVPFQEVASAWGYNWCFMEIDGQRLLGYADHAEPSCLLAWNGSKFEPFQELDGKSGRAFCRFDAHGQSWLAFANLLGESLLYRWNGVRFLKHQVLSGPGGREFEWLPGTSGSGRLVQVNFIRGSREAPQPVLSSFIHEWNGSSFQVVDQFATSGGTDAAAFTADGETFLAVANSLDALLRFRTDTCIYRVLPR